VHLFDLFSDPDAVASTVVRMLGADDLLPVTEPIDMVTTLGRG
jgi:hypothetical protein